MRDGQDVNDKQREEEEGRMIDEAFSHLLDTYMASQHRKKVKLITNAYNFARQAHKGVRRLSGEPYIMHPIAVAQIACEEMGLGSTSICSALLHDVVEDTDYTVEDIENIFGEKIAQIVDGLTKISGGIFGEKSSTQAENFKKLLLSMGKDIRVILIKICDRLHNMRTLESQPTNKIHKITGETTYIYAPLAYRLGLNKIKSELENLSFKYEHPDDYAKIVRQLETTNASRETLFNEFTEPIRKELTSRGFNFQIKARVKTPYSIWRKEQRKHVSFGQIYDILAVRIIFTPKDKDRDKEECYDIQTALCHIYKKRPNRERDWVNQPKSNGYQALHNTFMSNQGKFVEVQIRSDRMDKEAEYGIAAHWKYKNGDAYAEEDSAMREWLNNVKNVLDDSQSSGMDFLENVKLNLYSNEIFVFTPKGEMKAVPTGCSVLDFAYTVHTFLGNHCIGAKVNHKLVPLSHPLQSGDQVEVLTSQSQSVHPEWLNFVSTAKAKVKIMVMLRKINGEYRKKGEKMLADWLKAEKKEMNLSAVNKLCYLHNKRKPDELYLEIGNKTIDLGKKDLDCLNDKKRKTKFKLSKLVPFLSGSREQETVEPLVVSHGIDKKKTIFITEENVSQFLYPACCHPIPGDEILGYIDNDNHIEIHSRDCQVAAKLKTTYGNSILDVKWDMHKRLFFDATVEISGIDRKGMLRDVANVITNELDVNIHKLTISSDKGIFNGTVELRVHDREEMKNIMKSLKKVNGIKEVLQTS